MTKKELEERCKTLEKMFEDIYWMAQRYAHGRKTYAVSTYNDAVKKAQEMGLKITPDPATGLVEAKDGMFDKDWFEEQEKKDLPKLEKNCGAWGDDEGC